MSRQKVAGSGQRSHPLPQLLRRQPDRRHRGLTDEGAVGVETEPAETCGAVWLPGPEGEVWLAELNPTRGHRQRGTRPVLVLSVDSFNSGPAELVTVLPATSTIRPVPSHVEVHAPEGGLDSRSAILADQLRTIARKRLVRRSGAVSRTTLQRVEEVVRFLLGL